MSIEDTTTAADAEKKRWEGLIWQLNHRLTDLRQHKVEQWRYVYSAMGAQATILVLLLAKPEQVTTVHRIAGGAVAIIILVLWWYADRAVAANIKVVSKLAALVSADLDGYYDTHNSLSISEPEHERKFRTTALRTIAWYAVLAMTLLTLAGAIVINNRALGLASIQAATSR